MSTKLRGTPPGQPDSELTKLKALWRDTLSESARDYWRQLFASLATQPEIRKQISAKLKINLTANKQLTNFCAWLTREEEREKRAELQFEAEENLKRMILARVREEHPEWTETQVASVALEEARKLVLIGSYAETLATGQFNLGLATAQVELRAAAAQEEKQRYRDARRTDEEKALALVLEDCKAFPEVTELFKAAFAALRKAKGK